VSKEIAIRKSIHKTKALQARSKELSPLALIAVAVREHLPMETIERLTALYDKALARQAEHEFNDAMRAFQSELLPVVKTKVVPNKRERVEADGWDPVRFRYAPIEKIAVMIQKGRDEHGFSYAFDAGDYKDSKMPVYCDIHHKGGHEKRTTFWSPVSFEAGKTLGQSPAQVVNGAITFGRRVALIMGFGIMTADPEAEGDHQVPSEAQEPKSVEEAQAGKKQAAGTKETKDQVFEDVTKLIEEKCSGKAAQSFIAIANKHYEADRKDLLVALRDSLKKMRQGAK